MTDMLKVANEAIEWSEAATAGPWEVAMNEVHGGEVAIVYGAPDGYANIWSPNWCNGLNHIADRYLIAFACNNIAALARAYLEAKEEIESLKLLLSDVPNSGALEVQQRICAALEKTP